MKKSHVAKIAYDGSCLTITLPKDAQWAGKDLRVKQFGSTLIVFPAASAWDMMASTFGKASADFLPDRNQPALKKTSNGSS